MTEPVRPVSPVERRKPGERRTAERRQPAEAAAPESRDLVPAGPPAAAPAPEPARPSPTAFAAQLIGQDGQKRGLKGGQAVLDQARSTYLSAEYSGPADRRPAKGKAVKSEL